MEASPATAAPASTAEYFAGRQAAPRPANSTLDLTKITATGFQPTDGTEALRRYLDSLP